MECTPDPTIAPGRGKPGKEMTPEEANGFKLLGHCDFGGRNKGDVMQLLVKDDFILCGHVGMSGAGTSVIDASNPRKPRLVHQIPAPRNTHTNKLQIVGDIMVVNNEQFGGRGPDFEPFKAGIDIYDISNLPELRPLGYFHTGGRGVHRFWFGDGRYAFLTAGDDEYIDQFLKIIDLKDPTRPKEVGRWAMPGMRNDEERDWYQMGQFRFKKNRKGEYIPLGGEVPEGMKKKRACVHMSMNVGDRCYGAWWDSGFIILDIADITNPALISHTQWPPEESSATHSVLPLPERNICIVSDECTAEDMEDIPKQIRVMDISDEKNPQVLSTFPHPEGDYAERGGRSGPHNLHENRPDSLIDQSKVYMTWFNGGLRVFDIEDPLKPREVAHYVPETPRRDPIRPLWGRDYELLQVQVDDVYMAADGRAYISERLGAGVWILESDF